MKYLSFSLLIMLSVVIPSCSTEQRFKTISPKSILFVHEDGTPLLQDECINPNTNYALLIKTTSDGDGIFRVTKIEYTLNGVPYVMSFSSDGEQLNKIKLIDGDNKAEILGSSVKTYLYFNSHENFELVK